jgi:SRSO17 transposase
MAGYSSPEGFGMIDYTLYMPNQWFKVDFKSLRRRCQVPKDLKYLTKNQILLMMINKAKESGNFQGKYIGVDSSFGDDQTFLDSISKNFVYFAEISDTTLVFNGHQDILISNEYYENSKFSMLKSLNLCKVRDIVTDESYPWKSTVLDIVENGPIIVLDKCIKVIECRDGKPARPIWLYVRRLKDDSMIYALCNESVDSPPETVRTAALMRWPIKQCIRDYRKRLGMDQYEVRSWPGWRRHMLFTFIANLFSMKLKKLSLIKTTKTNATKN